MNKPTKIQRTVEFDDVESEAYSVFSLEAPAALQTALALLESYIAVDRQDTDYLLLAIDDIRKSLYTVDIILGDASTILHGRREYLQSLTAPPSASHTTQSLPESASQIEQSLKSSLESLKSSIGTPKMELDSDEVEKETEK